MASVAAGEIFAARNAGAGTSHGPNPGNFGMTQVPTAGYEFYPRGAAADVGGMAAAMGYGENPLESTVVTLDSWETVSYQYMAPSTLGDGSDMLIMSRMLSWIVKVHNVEDESTIVLTLPKLNKMAQDQWNSFVRDTTGDARTNPYFDEEKFEFLGWMQSYGERSLEAYAYARSHGLLDKNGEPLTRQYEARTNGAIRSFFERSTKAGYCYLTRYGWYSTVEYAGVVNNTNRAETLLGLDDTSQREHYLQVNIAYAKRCECAQQFGDNNEIIAGARLWVYLTRKRCPGGGYGAFVLIPGGSKRRDGPSNRERVYADESGMLCRGHVWRVGIVTDASTQAPSVVARERANNTGDAQDEQLAYQMHAVLPSFYAVLGYKH